MEVIFDPAKDLRNRRLHGVSLRQAEGFDMTTAAILVDDREDYGEVRYNALGFLQAALFSLTFTVQDTLVRAISLRKATKQEERHYADNF